MNSKDYYPAGAYDDPRAPYNEPEIPEVVVNINVSQTLSRSYKAKTNDYIPGAEYPEYDDDGNAFTCRENDNFDNTNLEKALFDNNCMTPLELIKEFEKSLKTEKAVIETVLEGYIPTQQEKEQWEKSLKRLNRLLANCKEWTEDDLSLCIDE